MEKSNSDHVILFMEDQQHNIKNPERPQPKNPISITEPKTTPTPQFTSRTQTLRRLSFSKPKARNVEFNLPPPTRKTTTIPEYSDELEPLNPTNYSTDDSDDDDEEEEFEEGEDEMGREKLRKKKKKKVHWKAMVEWALFIIILTCLVCSLTIESVKTHMTWGVEVWRWCLMVMVIFSGRLVSGWVMGFVVFLIERNFMLREKVLYFVYGLRKSFQNCVWLGLVLLSWTFMFNPNVHHKDKMLGKLFKALVAVLIGATIWLIKIVLVKVLASSFHVATYFDRMKESVFHHYILNTLSGPPMDEAAYEAAHNHNNHHLAESKTLPAKLRKGARSLSKSMKRFGSRRVDIEKLRKMSLQSTKSAWSVKRLVNYVRFFGLSTISNTVDGFGSTESEIGSEWEARNCAKRIFKNVAKQGAKYIEEEDLMRFLTRVEIHTIFPLFEGALETGKITKSAFRNWVMVVEEMNILTTVFLRYDMEKIYYPNSVLLTKPISNFYRSPEMIDLIDFAIDVSTSIDSINALKTAIQTYLENKPKHWNPKHLVMVKEIQDMNKMKMCLCVQHTMNHQNYFERNCRVTELILELKKICENLGIKYRLLPQEIHLTQVDAANWRAPLQS